MSLNPVRTGYSAIADEWLGIKPGTDGLFVGALIHELLAAQKIDGDYLLRYTNSSWLVIDNPGGADDGLFARDKNGIALVWDAAKNRPGPNSQAMINPALMGRFNLPDGRKAATSFTLIAERFLKSDWSPELVSPQCGVPVETIKRIAAELARVAFEEQIELDIAWTDHLGRTHDKMIGRPVSMHAMRGISAHANGFHTCRIIHFLQIMLGTIDVPGGFRYKAPYPKPVPPRVKPAGKTGEVRADTPLPGQPLGFVMSPKDLLVDDDGKPLRIDKAFSWDAPLSAHGLMHMVTTNAALGDPYPIDVLFLYMSNMSWNSAMNVPDTIKYLTAKNPASGEHVIPKIIYCDAYASEMVYYADLVLPDTTYLERWDAISMLDRPISEADGPADAIRQPVVEPDRDVRPFQSVLLDLGARLGLPAMVKPDNSPRYPGGYADYIVNHERSPGIGPLAGWRGEDGKSHGKGAPNPNQLKQYIDNDCYWFYELPDTMKYYKHANKAYLEWAVSFGFLDKAEPVIHQLYCEPLQTFRLAARGHGDIVPPAAHKQRIEKYFDPIPFWYAPFEDEMVEKSSFPMHAVTQRPMAMYHAWGSQNAWLRQIIGRNWLYIARSKAAEIGVGDGDWVIVTSHHGKIKAPVKLMDGVNPDTVWTWNAIGKRSGSWALDKDATEARQGFLLNHLISELLPERGGGYRFSNSDPVTGQAAWYDLKVRVEKAADQSDESAPQFPAIKPLARTA